MIMTFRPHCIETASTSVMDRTTNATQTWKPTNIDSYCAGSKEETTTIGHRLQRDLQSMLHRSATHSLSKKAKPAHLQYPDTNLQFSNALHMTSCTQALFEGFKVCSGKAFRMEIFWYPQIVILMTEPKNRRESSFHKSLVGHRTRCTYAFHTQLIQPLISFLFLHLVRHSVI